MVWFDQLRIPVSCVRGVGAQQTQRLEFAPFMHALRDIGDEAVDQRVVPIFREVDDPGLGIDAHRFVVHASHTFDRFRFSEFGFLRDGDLKAVPMIALKPITFGEHRFFAADPSPPRRRTTGAVVLGSCEREPVLLNALLFEVVDHCCATTPRRSAEPDVVDSFWLNLVEPFIASAEGRDRAVRIGNLMVADQDATIGINRAILFRKWVRRHPIVLPWDDQPIIHRRGHRADDPIRESFG